MPAKGWRKDHGVVPLCACGCGELVRGLRATGTGHREWTAYIHGHRSRVASKETTADRFWSRVDRGDGSGCWLWTGALSGRRPNHTYAAATVNGKRVYGHVWVYEQINGPIPKGYYVCHHCDNARCVRPDHLFLGTPKDNTEDMIAKKRGLVGSQNGQARLSNDDVMMIREIRRVTGQTHRVIAERFRVSPVTITNVLNGKTYKGVS